MIVHYVITVHSLKSGWPAHIEVLSGLFYYSCVSVIISSLYYQDDQPNSLMGMYKVHVLHIMYVKLLVVHRKHSNQKTPHLSVNRRGTVRHESTDIPCIHCVSLLEAKSDWLMFNRNCLKILNYC
jgi:hypothetical protein